ncbi:MAG: hypothetical protein R3A10_20695 [Caldilineaceae bacterium]
MDELPERYPATNLYYQSMWDGSLGYELAAEFTSAPRLFGLEFDDRHASEVVESLRPSPSDRLP